MVRTSLLLRWSWTKTFTVANICCPLILGIIVISPLVTFAGRIVLEALILTSAVVSALTGYTFWASKKGKDFSFLGPILFTSLVVLLVTSFLQVYTLTFNPLIRYHHLILNIHANVLIKKFAAVFPARTHISCCLWGHQRDHLLGVHYLQH